jgi:uncharacterized protein involved in exopolysaccharide biosynthesis
VTGRELDEETSVWTYANVLLRRRYLEIALPLALAIGVGLKSLLSPREFTASASFIPQEPGGQQAGLGQLATQFGLTLPRSSASSPQFYADLLQTREVLREVATTNYKAGGSEPFSGDLIAYLKIRPLPPERAVAAAVAALRNMVTVSVDRITGLVRFQVDSKSPELSTQIASGLIELVNDYNLRRHQTQSRAEREFVEQRVAQVKSDLTAAEDELAAFLARNRRIADAPQLVAEEQRLQRQVTLRQQIYLGLAQSLEAAKIEEVRNTPVITVVDRPEGFVGPKARGTVQKVLLALFAGIFLAVGLAFFQEYLARQRRDEARGYQEFMTHLRALADDLRLGRARRTARSQDVGTK